MPGVVTGKPIELGGSLGREYATLLGYAYTILSTLKVKEIDALDLDVVVQGFGNAGYHCARILYDMGFRIIAVSDSQGAILNKKGLDPYKVLEHKNSIKTIKGYKDAEDISANGLLTLHCDILIPAALENQITENNAADNKKDIETITSYCRASHLKNYLNMTTAGAFGGRGLGQTCGVADPSQWMRMFGVDIDSRDATQLIERAKEINEDQITRLLPRLKELFVELPEINDIFKKSIRLYLTLKEIIKDEGFDFYTI